jgi:hypothetical protein
MANHCPFGQVQELLPVIVLEEYGSGLPWSPQPLLTEACEGLGLFLPQVNAARYTGVKGGAGALNHLALRSKGHISFTAKRGMQILLSQLSLSLML